MPTEDTEVRTREVGKRPGRHGTFPVGLLEKIAMYLDVRTLRSMMLASRRIYKAADGDICVWRRLCRTEPRPAGCTSLAYRQRLKEEYLLKRSWETGWNERARGVRYPTNTEITVIKVCDEFVFTASNSPLVQIWDMDMNPIGELEGHKGSVWALDYRERVLVTGGTDRSARVWDCLSRRVVHVLLGHSSTIRVVKIAEDVAITGSRDKTIRVWDMKSGRCRYLLRGHKESVRALDVLEQKGILVSGSYDGTCIVWNYRRGEGVQRIEGHLRRVYAVGVCGEHIFSGGQDRAINVSRLDGTLSSRMHVHGGTVFDMKKGDGGSIYTLSTDGVICKWDSLRARLLFRIELGHPAVSFALANGVIIAGTSKAALVYDSETGAKIRSLVEDMEGMYCMEATKSRVFIGCRMGGETSIRGFFYSTSGLSSTE